MTKNLKKKIIIFLLSFIVPYFKIVISDADVSMLYEGIHRNGGHMFNNKLKPNSIWNSKCAKCSPGRIPEWNVKCARVFGRLGICLVLFCMLSGCGKNQLTVLDADTDSPATGSEPLTSMAGQASSEAGQELQSSGAGNDSVQESEVSGSGLGSRQESGGSRQESGAAQADNPAGVPKVSGKAYIWGEVKNPGVYEFLPDARIGDIVEQAGGLTKNAAPGCVNLAALVEDGQEIHVYGKSEWAKLESSVKAGVSGDGSQGNPVGSPGQNQGNTQAQAQPDGQTGESANSQNCVNLNTATREQLMTIPGIGQAKADAILNYRQEHGAFAKIEDIMNISGIKEKMFQKIKNYIKV